MPIFSQFVTWFTSLPTSIARFYSIPCAFKTRFIRYAFRKLFLEFVKPGYLGEDELDAQIQADFVQFNDIELNHWALNNLLPSLPFSLKKASIKTGYLKLFSPNGTFIEPLLSLHSSHFTFHILPSSELSFTSGATLPDLVHSYAADFVHDAMLLPEYAGPSHSEIGSSIDREEHLVAAFTKLVQLVFRDIRFAATKTSISVVLPGQCRFWASIAEISIQTEEHNEGRDRTMVASGITVHFEDFTHSSQAADNGMLLSFGRDPVRVVLSGVSRNKLRIFTNVGSIGVRIHCWHVARLIQVLDACLFHCNLDHLILLPPSPPIDAEVLLHIQGIVVLLCTPSTFHTTNFDTFFIDPNVPPRPLDGYVHIKLVSLTMQHSILSILGLMRTTRKFCIHECSVFGFRATDESEGAEGTTFPILITDRFLLPSYSPVYIHGRPPIDPRKNFVLPEFDANDWTDEDLCSCEPNPSPWRTRLRGVGAYLPDTHPAFTLRLIDQSQLPATCNPVQIQIDLAPLRIFIDLNQALCPEVLGGLDEILAALYRTASSRKQVESGQGSEVSFTLPSLRCELRCPLSGLPTRSGTLLIDIRGAHLVSYPNTNDIPASRCSSSDSVDELVFSLSSSCVLVACSPANGDKAFTVLSIGPITENRILSLESIKNRHARGRNAWFGVVRAADPPRLSLFLNLPSVVGRFSGQSLDDIQYWCLDAAHILEVHSHSEEMNTPMIPSTSQSLIGTQSSLLLERKPTDIYRLLADLGRCFFIRSKPTSYGEEEGRVAGLPNDFETAIKISVDEAVIRLLLPITGPEGMNPVVHSLDILSSTLDVNIVFKDEGTKCEIETVQLTGENRVSPTVSHEFFSIRPLNGFPTATLKAQFPPRSRIT